MIRIDNNKALENELPRPDVRVKVAGTAKYAADQYPDKVIYAKYVRFPYGKGTVVSADFDAASKVKGVLEAVSYDKDECQYPGERIGHIVAESKYAIEDAIETLGLSFRRLDARSKPEQLFEGVPDVNSEEVQELQRIYDQAELVVEATYTTQVQTHSCLEPHGSTVDHRGNSLEAWTSTQAVVGCEDGFKDHTGLSGSDVTVHAEFVGGGFGSKFSIGPEGTLAADASRKFKRPCRVLLDRREEHYDGGNRPGSIQYMKIGVDKNGKMLGGRIHCASTVGFGRRGGGVRNPNYYDFGNVIRTDENVWMNAGLPKAFRAPGYPQGSFALESMLDELAAAIGMDPVEFRKVNEQSDRRKRQLDWGAEVIGWSNRQPDGSAPGVIKTGYGCAGASWGNSQGRCEVDIDVFRNGEVEVRVGIQDIGTGASAMVVDVVADHMGLTREEVRGKVGNSDYPPGPASGGSVTSRFTAPALRDAAQKALNEMKEIVAKEAGVAADGIDYSDGNFVVRENGKSIGWKDACSIINSEKLSVRGSFNEDYFGEGVSDCVQFARVEVDTETGIVKVKEVAAIQSCGQVMNRLTAENQICGGVIQGVSFALFENRRLDRVTGGQVNTDLLSYKIAGPKDVPIIHPILDVIEGDTGVRAIGEPTTIPTSAAIANAVANAIGARVRDLPITPDRVIKALEQKDQGGVA